MNANERKQFIRKCKEKNIEEIKDILNRLDKDSLICFEIYLKTKMEQVETWNSLFAFIALFVAIITLLATISKESMEAMLFNGFVSVLLILSLLAAIAVICLMEKPMYCRAYYYVEAYIQNQFDIKEAKDIEETIKDVKENKIETKNIKEEITTVLSEEVNENKD